MLVMRRRDRVLVLAFRNFQFSKTYRPVATLKVGWRLASRAYSARSISDPAVARSPLILQT